MVPKIYRDLSALGQGGKNHNDPLWFAECKHVTMSGCGSFGR